MEKCKDNKEATQIGTEWCVEQSKELIAAGVPCLHYYTMGTSGSTKLVAEKIF